MYKLTITDKNGQTWNEWISDINDVIVAVKKYKALGCKVYRPEPLV